MVAAGFTTDEASDALRMIVRHVLATELLTLAVISTRNPLSDEEIDQVAEDKPLVGHLVRSLTERPPHTLEDPALLLMIEGLQGRLTARGVTR
jgi:hypothetical protein